MDLSKIKLIVTDMDGTLLNSKHEVSSRFFELFYRLRQRNIMFAAASGRQYDNIAIKLDSIKDDIIIIAENGGFAVKDGQEIVSNPLENHVKNEILSLLEKVENSMPVLCAKDTAYVQHSSPAFLGKLSEYYSSYKILKDLREYEGEVMKIAVYNFESSEKHIYPAVKHFEGRLKVKVSGEHWVDLSHKDAHKGYPLDLIQKNYGIGRDETLVFGDYNNDLEMMALSDYSFAMANAHPNVLRAANYTTASNDDFGVEKILEKVLETGG